MALNTGYGAMPPRAQSEPASIVSHRSLSSAVLAAASAGLAPSRGDNAVHHFHSSYGPDPARRALPARLDGTELHRISSHHRHIDGIVEDDDSAVPHHGIRRGERLVVEGRSNCDSGMNAPSGPPTWTARIGRPLRLPPPKS